MTEARSTKTAYLRPIADIEIGERLRWADPAKVEILKASFAEIGHKVPITVWGNPLEKTVRLSAGLHRLKAGIALGWDKILCIHEDGDDLDRRLWEIDENLCRAELTPVDRALFVAERKEIYLQKHPETAREATLRRGSEANSPSRQVGETGERAERFTAATAAATGQSERSIQRDATRGENIIEEALHLLRGTRLNTGQFLDRLKQIPPEKQVLCVKAALDEEKQKEAHAAENRRAKAEVRHSVRLAHMGFVQNNGAAKAGQVAKKYSVLYADPPWQFSVRSEVTGREKSAENHYPTMPTDEICGLFDKIGAPAKSDAVLFLWATNPMLPDALRVMEAWGFTYVHHWIWDKEVAGNGYWGRDRHELLLIGRRGNPAAPLMGTQPETVYAERKGAHSAKPMHYAELIEGYYPGIPKLELFNRKASLAEGDIRRNGKWDFWGFEAEGEGEPEQAPVPAEPSPVQEPVEIDRELYRNAVSILHEGVEFNVALLQERLDLDYPEAFWLFKRIRADFEAEGVLEHGKNFVRWVSPSAEDAAGDLPDEAESAPAVAEDDPVRAAVLAAGLAPNAFILDLNRGPSIGPAIDLPSRLFRSPIEFMDRKRGGNESRLLLRHPLLRDVPEIAAFILDVETKTGLTVAWEAVDEFGRDFGKTWRWYHAVDLCGDKHWKDLLDTRQFTDSAFIFNAVSLNLQSKGRLSVKNARAIMAALESVEPEGRSAADLAGKGLWPYRDGSKKYIAPNIRDRNEASAWLVIHGIEDGWLAYVGGHLSVTEEGMQRREAASRPAGEIDVPLDLAMPAAGAA